MSSLGRSLIEIWKATPALTALVPIAAPSPRVFVGRMPSTQRLHNGKLVQDYQFPYVSINLLRPAPGTRTSLAMQSFQAVGFDVWVDDAKLATGEAICEAIVDAYANTCWRIDEVWKVMDCRAEGPPTQTQIDLPTVKAWKLIQLFDLRLERLRVDSGTCCTAQPDIGSTSSGGSQGDWPEPVPISQGSTSQPGQWPQDIPTN